MRRSHFAFLFVLFACSGNPNERQATTGSKFKSLISVMPVRTLPVDFLCGIPEGGDSPNISDLSEYKDFFPSAQNILYGLLKVEKNFVVTVYGISGDDVYPTLFVYDTLGNRIDSLSLILSGCGGADEAVIPVSTASINQSLQILLTDTLHFIHYPEGQKNFVRDSVKVSFLRYHINDVGRIVKD